MLKVISPHPPALLVGLDGEDAVGEYTSFTPTSEGTVGKGGITEVKYLLRAFSQEGTPTQELLRNEGRSGTMD